METQIRYSTLQKCVRVVSIVLCFVLSFSYNGLAQKKKKHNKYTSQLGSSYFTKNHPYKVYNYKGYKYGHYKYHKCKYDKGSSLSKFGTNTYLGDSAFASNISGKYNSAFGFGTLLSNTEGNANVAMGAQALYNNQMGDSNVVSGYRAMYHNVNGRSNVATGRYALYSNISGFGNVAQGANALYSNTSARNNTAIGYASMFHNTTGNYNLALGYQSMFKNVDGTTNIAIGYRALHDNISGSGNVASGYESLFKNTKSYNSAYGYAALRNNISGEENTVIGYRALFKNNAGNSNTVVGANALINGTGSGNIAIGKDAMYSQTSGDFNMALGYAATVTKPNLTNAIAIGRSAKVSASNSMVLGGTGQFAVNVGIGTSNPNSMLELYGNNKALSFRNENDHDVLLIGTDGRGNGEFYLRNKSGENRVYISGANNENIYFNNGGAVGIGTTTMGGHKLAVEGSIGAREIKVEASEWADYVFDENYQLPALQLVDAYIKENKHLIGVPSEAEVLSNGIDLARMDATLLKKIEELTLYIIEQEKQIQELKAMNAEVEILKQALNALLLKSNTNQ